jgi:hypothetical protein
MFKYRHSCYAWSAGFEGLCLTGIPYRSRIVPVSFGPVSFSYRSVPYRSVVGSGVFPYRVVGRGCRFCELSVLWLSVPREKGARSVVLSHAWLVLPLNGYTGSADSTERSSVRTFPVGSVESAESGRVRSEVVGSGGVRGVRGVRGAELGSNISGRWSPRSPLNPRSGARFERFRSVTDRSAESAELGSNVSGQPIPRSGNVRTE